ncbi:BRISC and BRCA1-A complex member 2, partial [Ataeniobius toweri]|nr:BRISC and BRCA1-A complex member 2 [Ataeniobius toweri]
PTLVSFRVVQRAHLMQIDAFCPFLGPRTVDTMNNMSPEVALHRISPELRPLLCSVVRNGRVGLDSTNCLRVTDLKTGCTSLTPGPCCDRFKLHIPYAGETLKWDIIFNAQYPELPPDFIFGEDAEFLPEPSELP